MTIEKYEKQVFIRGTLVIFIMCMLLAICGYCSLISNKEKQENQIKQLKKDKEWLADQLSQARECECGIYELEDGYIIDGAWYEYKGEYNELFEE